MKLAFCSEDRTDDEILKAIIERISGEVIESLPASLVIRRAGGWHQVLKIAPKIARAVFNLSAHGAVFAVDADGTTAHNSQHTIDRHADCRTCQLMQSAGLNEVLSWERPALPPLQFLFAVPVQMLETWLLLSSEKFPTKFDPNHFGKNAGERRRLKHILYVREQADAMTRLRIALPIAKTFRVEQVSRESSSFAEFAKQVRDSSEIVRNFRHQSV